MTWRCEFCCSGPRPSHTPSTLRFGPEVVLVLNAIRVLLRFSEFAFTCRKFNPMLLRLRMLFRQMLPNRAGFLVVRFRFLGPACCLVEIAQVIMAGC